MVNWGVIGCGGIARRRMIPALGECRKSRLVAVMDANREATDAVAAETGVKGYYTDGEILSAPDVQAVYIATPVFLHRDQVLKAAAAGKHILLEKPLAISLEYAQDIMDACRKAGVFLAEGYMMKFHALNTKAKEMVEQGQIGKPVYARAQLTCWYPDMPGAWRQDPKLGGGGALMDMATHCYDLLEYIVGSKIKEVFAFTSTQTFKYAVDDSSTTLLRFENGAQAAVEAFFNIPDAAGLGRLEVYGNKGSLLAEGTIGQSPNGRMLACISDDALGYDAQQARDSLEVAAREVSYTPVNMYAAELDAMSASIEAGTPPAISTPEEGYHILQVAKAAYESSRTGQKVVL